MEGEMGRMTGAEPDARCRPAAFVSVVREGERIFSPGS